MRWPNPSAGTVSSSSVSPRRLPPDNGAWTVTVRPQEQTPAEAAELAEQVEALVAEQTSDASGVRLGRRIAGAMSAEQAKEARRPWLEGCVWAMARASGLDWDGMRRAVVAETLRRQTDGWEAAVTRAVGGPDADPSGA